VAERVKGPVAVGGPADGGAALAASLWLCGVAALTPALTSYIRDDISSFLLVLLCFLTATPIFLAVRRRSLVLCEPVFYTVMIFALAYPAQVLYEVVVAEGPFTPYGDVWQTPAMLRRGLVYCVVGLSTYLITYYGSARLMARAKMPWLRLPLAVPTPVRIWAVYALGWSIRLYMILSGNFSTFYDWSGFDARTATVLWTAAQLPWLAYILSWLTVLGHRPSLRAKLTLAAIFTLEAGYHMTVSASKTFLALLLLYPILAVSLQRRKLPVVAVLGFAAALFLFIFPFVASQRESQSAAGPDVSGLKGFVDIARQAATRTAEDTGGSEVLRTRIEMALSRWHGFDSLCAAMLTVPDQIDFIYFQDVLLLPGAFLPRAIAPWKPVGTLSVVFPQTIYEGGGSAVSPFPIAEGYINGGVLGIAVLMCALALIQNWFYRGFYLPRAGQTVASATYLYLFFGVTNLDSSLLAGWVGCLQSAAILAAVVLAFLSPRKVVRPRV
jgi:hypothetical protein